MEVLRVLPAAPRRFGDVQADWPVYREAPLRLADLAGVLRRRIVLVVGTGLIGAAAAFGAAQYFKSYAAKALILVEPPPTASGRVGDLSSDEQMLIETHITSMLSQASVAAVLKSFAPILEAEQKTLNPFNLEQRLKVQQELHSRVISVSFTATDAALAAAVSNRAATLYVDKQGDREKNEIARQLDRMRSRASVAKAEVDAARQGKDGRTEADALNAERRLHEATVLVSSLERQRDTLDRDQDRSSGVSLLSPALEPERPSTGNPVLLAVPAFAAFAILGFFVALGWDRADRSLRSERDAEQVLGIPCAGLLPHFRKSASGKDAIRRLAAPRPCAFAVAIKAIALEQGLGAPGAPHVVLVTSALPKEGKSALALALSAAAARLGRRTLLIDLSLNGQESRRRSPVRHQQGLLNVVERGEGAQNVIKIGPGLDRLDGGTATDDVAATLSGTQFVTVIDALRNSYDLVVIDGPCLLQAAEANALAGIADRVLVAVRWGYTRRDFVESALRVILAKRSAGGPHTMSVLTRVNLGDHARYHFGDRAEALRRLRRGIA